MTVVELQTANPFPWREEINFDGMGGVRLIDAEGKEVPLFSITGLAIYTTKQILKAQAAQAAATQQGTPA